MPTTNDDLAVSDPPTADQKQVKTGTTAMSNTCDSPVATQASTVDTTDAAVATDGVTALTNKHAALVSPDLTNRGSTTEATASEASSKDDTVPSKKKSNDVELSMFDMSTEEGITSAYAAVKGNNAPYPDSLQDKIRAILGALKIEAIKKFALSQGIEYPKVNKGPAIESITKELVKRVTASQSKSPESESNAPPDASAANAFPSTRSANGDESGTNTAPFQTCDADSNFL